MKCIVITVAAGGINAKVARQLAASWKANSGLVSAKVMTL
jgi:hypothetical protein